jgi:hypothetical protein
LEFGTFAQALVEHFVDARRQRLPTGTGKVIIALDLGMDWDLR